MGRGKPYDQSTLRRPCYRKWFLSAQRHARYYRTEGRWCLAWLILWLVGPSTMFAAVREAGATFTFDQLRVRLNEIATARELKELASGMVVLFADTGETLL